MFFLSLISNSVEFWSVNHASIHENPESKVFKYIKFVGEISSNWPNDLLETKVYNTLESSDNHYWQYYRVVILLQ